MEIDYYPRCRGMWLDRGELDKLLQVADRAHDDRWDDRDRDKGRYDSERPYGRTAEEELVLPQRDVRVRRLTSPTVVANGYLHL